MDTPRNTNDKLRFALNADQASRERMCAAILTLDRNYSDIRPRRPEGGPDGGRDIECRRNGDLCFGAVAFVNNAGDTNREKTQLRKKFVKDAQAARAADASAKAFVFFCNIDLTPSEVENWVRIGQENGFATVDIFWRERLRQALDSSEGVVFRSQYLGLSEAEQIELALWKAGRIRTLDLRVQFTHYMESKQAAPEHFRVSLQLEGTTGENRCILLGARDDYWKPNTEGWYFGNKAFFWCRRLGEIGDSWVKTGDVRAGGGVVSGIHVNLRWFPESPVSVSEFDGLSKWFFFTENLSHRISHVRFAIDNYIVIDRHFTFDMVTRIAPQALWPDRLTEPEDAVHWRCAHLGCINLQHLRNRSSGS